MRSVHLVAAVVAFHPGSGANLGARRHEHSWTPPSRGLDINPEYHDGAGQTLGEFSREVWPRT
jgi:hypothetical protein